MPDVKQRTEGKMEYTIIRDTMIERFIQDVEDKLDSDWELVGGMVPFFNEKKELTYFQTMVRGGE